MILSSGFSWGCLVVFSRPLQIAAQLALTSPHKKIMAVPSPDTKVG